MGTTYQVKSVKHGYFLAQYLVATGPEVIWRRIGEGENWVFSSAEEARLYFEFFKDKVDGVDFVPYEYQDADIPGVVEVAKLAQDYPIDLWLGPRIYKQIDNLPIPPAKYVSWCMDEKGAFLPAMRDVKRRPDIDRLNPEAVKWLMDVYYESFLKYFDNNLLHGLFWPEEHLGGNLLYTPGYDPESYWCLPAYSDASLELWREYCKRNQVMHKDHLVDKFPVHKPEMVSQGRGKTCYYPGFGVVKPPYASRYVNLPRCEGIWAHWFRYLCHAYLNNFLVPLSRQMHELNRKNPRWRGVVYFGSIPWFLPYERFTDPYASSREVGGNGYQYAIDVETMARVPEINYIICEFRGIVADRMSYQYELFLELIGKDYKGREGLLVHGDGRNPMCPKEEIARWEFIKHYQPRILSLFSLESFYPPLGPIHDKETTDTFFRRLASYQKTGNPFANE